MVLLSVFTLLVFIQISVFVAGNDKQFENVLLRIQELDTAIDKEIQETNELLELMQVGERAERASQACNSTVVGFHAQLTTTSLSMSSGEVIKFNKVITNVGDGYNGSTGVFTAPETGYYEFTVTIMAQSGNIFISRVLVNGIYDTYCRAYGSSRSQAQGMCDTIYYLSQGSTAKVTQYSGSALYGNGFSTFSGHLIA